MIPDKYSSSYTAKRTYMYSIMVFWTMIGMILCFGGSPAHSQLYIPYGEVEPDGVPPVTFVPISVDDIFIVVPVASPDLPADPGAEGDSTTNATAASLIYEGNDGSAGITITNTFYHNGLEAHFSVENPIINGNNVYAPDLVRNGNTWNLYYGGWRDNGQGNDRIYFAVSDDLIPEGPWAGQVTIITEGEYL